MLEPDLLGVPTLALMSGESSMVLSTELKDVSGSRADEDRKESLPPVAAGTAGIP